ncbi:O-antigen ligase family protein [Candidatus Daviesbacteria bacterium]|nr:O-antigen ligase family protein [Candidatus Daviesbacteria bacterium]
MRNLLENITKAQFLLFLFLLIFIPLYPKFPLLKVTGTFAAVRLEDIFITLALIIFSMKIILGHKVKEFLADKLIQAFLVFFFIGIISTFSAIFLTFTVIPHLGILHLLRRVELMLLLPLAFYSINSRSQLFISLLIFSGVILLINLYAIGQQYLGWPVISTTNSEFAKGQILSLTNDARVNSTFAGHYDLAIFLSGALAILTALFFYFKKITYRIWIFVVFGSSFAVLVMTAARLSFVAAIIGIIASLFLIKKRLFILLLLSLTLVALVYPSKLRDRFISTIVVNINQGGERYQGTEDERSRARLNISTLPTRTSTDSSETAQSKRERGIPTDIAFNEPTDPTQLGVFRSFQIRLNAEWPKAIRGFLKNPLLGSGYSSLGLASDNDYLRSLGEVGLLGSFALALILFEIIKRFKILFTYNDRFFKFLSAGMVALILTFLINAIFIDVFEASKIASLFWMFLGIGLAGLKLIPK